MQSKATNPLDYLKEVPVERREAFSKLRETILKNLPKGFEERMTYGMIGYVVPHSIYPSGYNCDPKLPLGMINLASQKNFIALYHTGIYLQPELLKWFTTEYPKHTEVKLDMGKGCIRFKKPGDIPLKLIGELVKKVSVKEYIAAYEKARDIQRK